MPDNDPWKSLAVEAAALFRVELRSEDVDRMRRFVKLLETWSPRMNLIGRASTTELVERHVLDSLAPMEFLEDAGVLADLGSGSGFPAIPLAVIRPNTRFHLVEPRRKRCSFLRQAARMLGLRNVAIWESRGEEWDPPATVDIVTSRALAVRELAPIALRILLSGGRLLLMRKQGAEGSTIEGFDALKIARYTLPTKDRHEIVALRRR